MTAPGLSWERSVLRVVFVVQWLALALGVFVGVFEGQASSRSLAAAGVALIYVAGTGALPLRYLHRPLIRETVSLAGSLLLAATLSLSGAGDSPYVLLSVTPTIFASFFGGLRPGIATSLLSAALLAVVVLAEEQPIATAFGWMGLYLIVSITGVQARRLALDAQLRAELAEVSSVAAGEQLDRLQRAHQLLSRLAELAANSEINPVAIGTAALSSMGDLVPGSSAVATIEGEQGPVIVARQGAEEPGAVRTIFPLQVGGSSVGSVVVWSTAPLSESQHADLSTAFQPLAFAFANIRLLQQIARTAIHEERTRLARELHDEIGPSLASLGLALDVTALEFPTEPGLTAHLESLRGHVTELVDEVRSTVSDLRHEPRGSLVDAIGKLVAELGSPPEVSLDIVERRPPRPTVWDDILGIVGEALRNAQRHSGAATVSVTGIVDFDSGELEVTDNGTGFVPSLVGSAHFGIVGMRERAANIGGRLGIQSGPAGTTVNLKWEPNGQSTDR